MVILLSFQKNNDNFDSIIKTDSFFLPEIIANPIYTLYFLSGATVMILNGQSRIGTRSADVRQWPWLAVESLTNKKDNLVSYKL